MDQHTRHTLDTISDRLSTTLRDDLEGFYAFGSRVRGDFTDESDFDLLVVIKHRTPEKVDTIVGIIVEIEMKNNLSFFPVIKDASSFAMERKYSSPFYQNVMNEGIAL